MDEASIDFEGARPLAADLALIEGLGDVAGLPKLLADLHGSGSSGLFGVRAGADLTDASMNILHVSQGGMGLPEKD